MRNEMKVVVLLAAVLFGSGRIQAQGLVLPELQCVDMVQVDDGSAGPKAIQVAHFGYYNPFTETVTQIAGSSTNFFSPGNPDRGQPSQFLPGRFQYVISQAIDASRFLVWIVGSQVGVSSPDPKIVCSALPTKPFLVPTDLKFVQGTTSYGVELMRLRWVQRDSTVFSATAELRQAVSGLSSYTLSAPATDIAVSNLRVTETAVVGDVTVVPSPSRRSYALTIKLATGGQFVAAKSVPLEVYSSCPITVSPSALPGGIVNASYTPVTLMGSGATGPYQFELASGVLPAGMQLVNGVLSGTPTEAGAFALSVNLISADRCLARQSYSLAVGGPACAADVTGRVSLTVGGFRQNLVTGRWQQTVSLTNTSGAAIAAPVMVALQSLSTNASLFNAAGVTQCASPAGRPYVRLGSGIAPGQSVSVALEFTNTTPGQAITYTPRVLAGGTNQ